MRCCDEFASDEQRALCTLSYAYGDEGELVEARDPLGNAERYAYDGERRLTRKTLPNGLSFHYLYDPESGRCVRSWGDGGLHAGLKARLVAGPLRGRRRAAHGEGERHG